MEFSSACVSSVVKPGGPPLQATGTESPLKPSSASSSATHAGHSPPVQETFLEPMSLALSDEDWLDYRRKDWLDDEERWKRDSAQETLEASWYTHEQDLETSRAAKRTAASMSLVLEDETVIRLGF